MLDMKWVRENPEKLDAAMQSRGGEPVSAKFLGLDEERRQVMTELQNLQSRRNDISRRIGQAKQTGEDTAPLFAEMKDIGPAVKALEEKEQGLQFQFEDMLSRLPNIPEDSTPKGKDENDNVEVRTWGTPTKLAFEPKHHFELGENLGQMDFEIGAKLAGSRFVWLQGQIAQLERALANYMLDMHTRNHGYTEVVPPFLANDDTLFGTGQLPKFAEDLFRTEQGLWLIPTSEVVLTNYVRDEIIDASRLPLKFTGLTPCFRSEAGSAGRDTRGYIRMHQFNKVEMVQITRPEESEAAFHNMVAHAESILKGLELPYRVLHLCTGDMGFCAQKTYDLEVWLPAQGKYREISSVSNCGDFQARRMRARFRADATSKNTTFVHTLNGSGLAVGRTLVAVLENYQQADGSIRIPDVLKPYMGGRDKIEAA